MHFCNVPSRPIGEMGRYKRDRQDRLVVRHNSRVEDEVPIYDPSALDCPQSSSLGKRCSGDGGANPKD